MSYNKLSGASKGVDETYEHTLARIQKIQSHLDNAPRGSKLKGKVCIITGVGSLKGIGRATSILFAHEGAKHLYLLDFDGKNLPNLKETIEQKYPGVKVTAQQADAADEDAIKGICERATKEEGRLDVFFANAGIATKHHLHDISQEVFMESMRINALSCFLAIKHASTAMLKPSPGAGKEHSGGSIVLTASVAGLRSGAGTLDYSASKAAVNSMAKTSAYQLQKSDIRVNSICPGLIETGMTIGTFDYARQRGTAGRLGQLNPLGRFGVAEEIANAVLFLASDDSSYADGLEECMSSPGDFGSAPPVP
ncbi:hypothetical protein Agabi119p4_2014 [Agaricus bisporus var. burnettii]|uniref:NAD(P)-binding protein n=1 Tax=Agaricus bisporus var. burnettii TaxID=192524 RepID=A0A8H7F8G1_AGABI|nr:hypothetical protein Agabi119p4_2014 [Agaricus bisporus var. burnettii]